MGSSVSIYNAEMPILRDLFKMAATEAHAKAEKLKSKFSKDLKNREVWCLYLIFGYHLNIRHYIWILDALPFKY